MNQYRQKRFCDFDLNKNGGYGEGFGQSNVGEF